MTFRVILPSQFLDGKVLDLNIQHPGHGTEIAFSGYFLDTAQKLVTISLMKI
jgi:hypothetical protein